MNHQHTLVIYLQQLNPDSLSKRSLSAGSWGVGNGRTVRVSCCSLLSWVKVISSPLSRRRSWTLNLWRCVHELPETTASPCKEPSPAGPCWQGRVTPQRGVLLTTFASLQVNKLIPAAEEKKTGMNYHKSVLHFISSACCNTEKKKKVKQNHQKPKPRAAEPGQHSCRGRKGNAANPLRIIHQRGGVFKKSPLLLAFLESFVSAELEVGAQPQIYVSVWTSAAAVPLIIPMW